MPNKAFCIASAIGYEPAGAYVVFAYQVVDAHDASVASGNVTYLIPYANGASQVTQGVRALLRSELSDPALVVVFLPAG